MYEEVLLGVKHFMLRFLFGEFFGVEVDNLLSIFSRWIGNLCLGTQYPWRYMIECAFLALIFGTSPFARILNNIF